MTNYIFIIYSILILLSSVMVVTTVNPVHSVLFLILVFFNASALLILLEVEFLAMIFLIIYVGAIAVLFLFVVMMLNIKIIISNVNIFKYIPVGGIVALIFLLELLLFYNYDFYIGDSDSSIEYVDWLKLENSLSNIESIGNLIYTYYYDMFLVSGFILLVAMNGAIVLTLNKNLKVKRQDVFSQVYRMSKLSMIK